LDQYVFVRKTILVLMLIIGSLDYIGLIGQRKRRKVTNYAQRISLVGRDDQHFMARLLPASNGFLCSSIGQHFLFFFSPVILDFYSFFF